MHEATPSGKERVEIPTSLARGLKALMRWILAASMGVGAGAAGGHLVGTQTSRYIVGERMTNAEVVALEKQLKALQARKAKRVEESPGTFGYPGKFYDWLGDVKKPGEWLGKNEPALKAKIELANKTKDMGDIFEMLIYVFAFALAFREIAPRVTTWTKGLLDGRARVSRDKQLAGAINTLGVEFEEQSKVLDAVIETIMLQVEAQKDPTPENIAEVTKAVERALELLAEARKEGFDPIENE